MTLADLIAPAAKKTSLHFLDEGVELSLGQMWSDAESLASWNTSHGCEPIAMVLTNTSACATALVGAIVAGVDVVSIPPPPRGADFEWYANFVRRSCVQCGAKTLVVDEEYLALLPPLDRISYATYQNLLDCKGRGEFNPEKFRLTQFTSGSTADPKGIVLDQANIVSNVSSILDWLRPRPGDGACSWLPLSHDMGLIGMFLSALAGAGPRWSNGADIVVLSPEGFLKRPLSWLEAISDFGSTITSAPNFGFEMAMKRRGNIELNLKSVRACITGAEPVRAETLLRFEKTFGSDGFSSLAFCPAYGLAESTLAVAATPSDEHWHALALDPDGIAQRVIRSDPNGTQIVSSGNALKGVEIQIDAEDAIGEIRLRSASIAQEYADGQPAKDAKGWFSTSDLGFVSENELYIIGRLDDVFQIAGRNIYALDVETHVGSLPGLRQGRVVAFSDTQGDLNVVAEYEGLKTPAAEIAKQVASNIRDRVRSRIGVAPRCVVIVRRGELPMTSSGKTQRSAVKHALDIGSLSGVPGSFGV